MPESLRYNWAFIARLFVVKAFIGRLFGLIFGCCMLPACSVLRTYICETVVLHRAAERFQRTWGKREI